MANGNFQAWEVGNQFFHHPRLYIAVVQLDAKDDVVPLHQPQHTAQLVLL